MVRIIIVCSHSDQAHVEDAFLSGAQAYVTKGSAVFQIPEAIEASWAAGRFGPDTNPWFLSTSRPASPQHLLCRVSLKAERVHYERTIKFEHS
jgi:DNA-binding NarL/FixJ family response regulator